VALWNSVFTDAGRIIKVDWRRRIGWRASAFHRSTVT
jgi:hypothetical protein